MMEPGGAVSVPPTTQHAGAPAEGRFRVTPLHGAAAVDPASWNRLATRGHHLHRWFVAVEAAGSQPRHLAVRDATGLRAIVPAYLEHGGLHGDLHDRWFGPARGLLAAVGLRLRPSIAVVLPLGAASQPLGDIDALPDSTVDDIFSALEDQARAEGARAVVWPFVAGDQARLLRIGARRGYVRAFAGSTARLAIAWTSFDEYLTSRSRSVRRTIRRELRELEKAGIELRSAHDFRASAAAAESLYRAGFLRRNGSLPALEEGFFSCVAESADDSLWAQTAWQGDTLVGVSLNMVAGDRLDGGLAAFAPIAAEAAVYAADLVYEPVSMACERRYRTIELGPTALQAKLLRGAVLVPRFALARGINRAVHTALSTVASAVDAWTLRKEQRSLGPFAPRGGL